MDPSDLFDAEVVGDPTAVFVAERPADPDAVFPDLKGSAGAAHAAALRRALEARDLPKARAALHAAGLPEFLPAAFALLDRALAAGTVFFLPTATAREKPRMFANRPVASLQFTAAESFAAAGRFSSAAVRVAMNGFTVKLRDPGRGVLVDLMPAADSVEQPDKWYPVGRFLELHTIETRRAGDLIQAYVSGSLCFGPVPPADIALYAEEVADCRCAGTPWRRTDFEVNAPELLLFSDPLEQ